MSDKFQESVLERLEWINMKVQMIEHYLKNQPSHEQMKFLLESTTTGPWMSGWNSQRSKENRDIIQLLEIIAKAQPPRNTPLDTPQLPFGELMSNEWYSKKNEDERIKERMKTDAEGCHMQTYLRP